MAALIRFSHPIGAEGLEVVPFAVSAGSNNLLAQMFCKSAVANDAILGERETEGSEHSIPYYFHLRGTDGGVAVKIIVGEKIT